MTCKLPLSAAVLVLGMTLATSAGAQPFSGPLIKVSELATGLQGNPNAQYLVLRMWAGTSDGAPNVGGYMLVFYQIDGHETSRITLPADANNGLLGAPYLIANQAAQDYLNVTADFSYSLQAWPTQGTICVYEPGTSQDANSRTIDDCLTYGNVANPTQINSGALPNLPVNPAGGVPIGTLARRYQSTTSSTQDFWLLGANAAWPENNAGLVGSPNATACGSGTLDGWKECDLGSNNGQPGAGCSSDCLIVPDQDPNTARCSNGVVDAGEECDDTNTVDKDGCSSVCQWEDLLLAAPQQCGNYILELPEDCDAGPIGNSACDSNCNSLQPPTCGNGAVEPGEQCDTHDAADCDTIACVWLPSHTLHTCGNGVVEASEQCDDGNVVSGDGCSSACVIETASYFVCGDSLIEPGEDCDGSVNCDSNCRWVTTPVQTSGGSTTGGTGAGSTTGVGVNTTSTTGIGGLPPTVNPTTGGSGVVGGTSTTTTTGGLGSTGGTTGPLGDEPINPNSPAEVSTTTSLTPSSCAAGGGGLETLLAAAWLLGRRRRISAHAD